MTRIIAVAALCLAVLFGSAAIARADDGIDAAVHDAALFCRWLDTDSTPEGVARAVNEFAIQGAPEEVAVGVITYALVYLCPEHVPAVQQSYEWYAGPVVLR